jgi:hypothetical protein
LNPCPEWQAVPYGSTPTMSAGMGVLDIHKPAAAPFYPRAAWGSRPLGGQRIASVPGSD